MNPKNSQQKIYKGLPTKYKYAIIVSKFNYHITKKLLDGAKLCLINHHVPKKNWKIFFCPGAFEIPQVANMLAKENKWDAIVCLGAVIRGETPHFEYISSETARGIQIAALLNSTPIVFGVLTTDDEKQAMERAGGKHGNKGWDAVITAFEMAELFNKLKKKHSR